MFNFIRYLMIGFIVVSFVGCVAPKPQQQPHPPSTWNYGQY